MTTRGGLTERGPETTSLFWIDALRVAAAVAVVSLHVAAEPVVFVRDRSSLAWWTGNLIDSAARWCVPIFVMLSGALLLPRRGEPTRDFFTRRVRRLAIPLVAWSAAYICFRAWRRGGMPGWEWIGDRLLYGRPEYHMWYVFMTLGLYLLTPPLRVFVARTGRRGLVGATLALLLVACIHDALFCFGFAPPLRTVFDMWLPYLGYYLAGHAARRHAPRISSGALAAAIAACIALIALGTRPLMDRYGILPAGLYLYEYLSPPVVAMSLAVFLLGSRIRAPAPNGLVARWVRDASGATLGIYLIHVMVIRLLRDQGLAAVPLGAAGVPIVAGVALVISYAAVSALRRLPLLRHTV
jgi:surface polysaccharide O-acyltransferase-like enzyme